MGESTYQHTSGDASENACSDYCMASLALLAEPLLTGTREKPKEKEPGPKYKAWREKYKAEIGKELRAKGFTPDEVDKVIREFVDALSGYVLKGKKGRGGMLKFIWKNLKRLWDAKEAIDKARKTVGDPPPFED
jgi:hypothetical protein